MAWVQQDVSVSGVKIEGGHWFHHFVFVCFCLLTPIGQSPVALSAARSSQAGHFFVLFWDFGSVTKDLILVHAWFAGQCLVC